jgi:sigma-B regulation protein RsbU (phosphoserine phosphatase)
MTSFSQRRGPITQTVGFRVALAVNLVMAVAVAAFLVYDYLRESRQRLAERVEALKEQALTIHQAVCRLRAGPPEQLQEYIDSVCGRVGDVEAPGHHIIAEIDGRVVQAQAHRRDSAEIYEAMRDAVGAPHSHGRHGGHELVVGTYGEQGVTVLVAEHMDDVRRAIRAQVLFRSVGVLVFGLVLAAAVNWVVRKVVTRPLRRLVRTIDEIGTGALGAQAGRFRSAELAHLAEAVNGMSRSLAEAEGRRQLALVKARRIQQNLLPPPGKAAGLSLAIRHRPAEAVAGDYYDVLPAADGSYLLCVADVVGHGVPAAMVAAMLKVLLLQAADRPAAPGDILRSLNRRFMAVSLPEDFASLFLARWDSSARQLCYASAGHEPALFVSGCSAPLRLGATGPPVGLLEDADWDTASLAVQPGDLLLALTDGVPEAMNAAGQFFGRERLADLLAKHRTADPEALLEVIDAAVLEHLKGAPVLDDSTLVLVKFS